MALITITDLYSRIYEDIVTEITREETALCDRAISAAIQEVKMYLSKFDLVVLFGNDTTEPTIDDMFLKNICVDIAVWNLVKLGTPNIKSELTHEIYDAAIKTLTNIKNNGLQPDGWAYKDTTEETAAPGDAIFATSNTKRNNHF
jgi:hypothetical protein